MKNKHELENNIMGSNDSLPQGRSYNSNYNYTRAIVVLGGPKQDKRLEKALYEYNKDKSAALIISGFGKDFEKKTEYTAKGKGLDSILNENESINTEDNARNSLYLIRENLPNINEITIVSDYAQQPRAEMLFNKYSKEYSDSHYQIGFSGIKTENKLHRVVYELGAFPLSIMPYTVHRKLTGVLRKALYGKKE
ncbi:MAG: protein of unknown function DUF218 [Candidatus Parvarchaeum acidophilus ARMAN-5]|jgi:uncharacterized SAM-binding protein YcdF (DUF218 family)|uniref:DUF218 domain-containing protein n=1 Tax=Candidatus Parvarchaeum acidophilus ARMAN-5 TaxID=662762 RepID=D6GX35_PARA5|nr:MAG: protein of unknown function DUF218 [Candidatus Parvarchaeum acidophilus ARMAN-5]